MCEGGVVGGVSGKRGENGDGGMASADERKGIGETVNDLPILVMFVYWRCGPVDLKKCCRF